MKSLIVSEKLNIEKIKHLNIQLKKHLLTLRLLHKEEKILSQKVKDTDSVKSLNRIHNLNIIDIDTTLSLLEPNIDKLNEHLNYFDHLFFTKKYTLKQNALFINKLLKNFDCFGSASVFDSFQAIKIKAKEILEIQQQIIKDKDKATSDYELCISKIMEEQKQKSKTIDLIEQ